MCEACTHPLVEALNIPIMLWQISYNGKLSMSFKKLKKEAIDFVK
jgi:hypothetical protein